MFSDASAQDYSIDHDLESGGREVSGECGLALAIIGQAFRDATGNTITRCKSETERGDIVAEARAFLLSESGAWCESREEICAIADVDPEFIRTKFEHIFRRACEADPAYAERCEEDDFAWARRKRQRAERERLAAERKAAEPERLRQKAERERLAAERRAERERIAAERQEEQRRRKQAQYQQQHRERKADPNWTPREPMSEEERAAARRESVRKYNAARYAKLQADLQSDDPKIRAAAEVQRAKLRQSQARSYRKAKARKRESSSSEATKRAAAESPMAARLRSSTCMTSWRLAA